MLNRMKVVMYAALVAAASLFPLGAMAQTLVYPTQIYEVTTGWGSDSFGVITDQPAATNPANCKFHDQYISDATDPGNRTYYAAALTAFANKTPAVIVVSNTQCSASGWPKILAINPYRN